MLYIGYLIILDYRRLGCSRLCSNPLPPPPPNTQIGPWALKYPYCHQIITQTHPRGNRRVLEKVEM